MEIGHTGSWWHHHLDVLDDAVIVALVSLLSAAALTAVKRWGPVDRPSRIRHRKRTKRT